MTNEKKSNEHGNKSRNKKKRTLLIRCFQDSYSLKVNIIDLSHIQRARIAYEVMNLLIILGPIINYLLGPNQGCLMPDYWERPVMFKILQPDEETLLLPISISVTQVAICFSAYMKGAQPFILHMLRHLSQDPQCIFPNV